MKQSPRIAAIAAFAAATVLALTGCSSTTPAPARTAPHATVAPAAPPGPHTGSCYSLDVAAALRSTSDARPVGCSQPHTAETVYVGTIDPLLDGHLVALDSARIQGQIARTCTRRVAAHVGGSTETRRLSRMTAIWFSPSLADADRGALWFRCDLVISAGPSSFAVLPRRTRGLLLGQHALDTWGTCGTAPPAAAGFRRVLCSARHSWRARTTIALPGGTRYLAAGAGKVASAQCHDVETRLAPNVLHLQWSFEWPTRAQWQAGQRYGLCWTPA